MRKLVAILLLLILPFQFSWAMASSYCSHHEQGVAAKHFGHHGDKHAHANTPDEEKDPSSSKSSAPVDASHACYVHGGVAALFSTTDMPLAQQLDSNSQFAIDLSPPETGHISLIERPNWRRLA